MLKRILACFCSFLVVFSFCCQCFVVSAAGTEGGSGGGGHRGAYTDLNRAAASEDSNDLVGQIDILNNPDDALSDVFYYALGTTGAIFSNETTLKSVRSQFNAIYANSLASPEEMRKIFYYGTDGQVYFTDEFLSNFRVIVDKNSFEQGIVSIPLCADDTVVQDYLSIGSVGLTNVVTDALQGNSVLLIPDICEASFGGGYKNSFSLGADVFSFSYIFPFQSFNDYRRYVNDLGTISSACFYSDDSCVSSNFSFSRFSTSRSSSGFAAMSDITVQSAPLATDFNGSFLSAYISSKKTNERGSTRAFYLLGLGTVEGYTDVEHFKFYSSGGTGVIRGNTYYAMDNAQNPDNIFGKDWKAYYQGLQKQYKQLAGEVASGNKTLKEINQILSDDILDTVADISQDVTQQTNYLKKILNELESISGKLTYSNVVETVSAASNLLSAVCDVLDSLFSSDDGVFSLLDFVETYVLDGTGKTIASVMQTVFPFSLPHDFYLILELLSVNPETPQVHFKFDLARLGMSYDYSYTANDFEKLAYMTRFFSSVGFVLLLINFTNKILKK